MKTFYEMMMIMEEDQEEVQAPEQGLGDEGQEQQDQVSEPQQEPPQQNGMGMERKHYMFFSNLKAIKEKAEAMLSMDPAKVDEMLDDGHDWASDHISTSRDDVEEVYNWLSGSVDQQQADSMVAPQVNPTSSI